MNTIQHKTDRIDPDRPGPERRAIPLQGPPAPNGGALVAALMEAQSLSPSSGMQYGESAIPNPESLLAEAMLAEKRAQYYRDLRAPVGGSGLSSAAANWLNSNRAEKYEQQWLEKAKAAEMARRQQAEYEQRHEQAREARNLQDLSRMYQQAFPGMNEAEAGLRARGKSLPAEGKDDEYQQRQRYGQQLGLGGEDLQRFVLTGKYGEEKEEKPEFDFDDAAKLRTEYNRETQGFADVTDSYGRIQASIEQPSAAGDLALIFNYMKMLDPGSTVREGEFATAQNSASIPERVRANYNRMLQGERLSDVQRGDFADRASRLYRKAASLNQNRRGEYHDLARRLNFDPEQIFIERQVLDSGPVSLTDPTPDMQPREGMVIHNEATGETLILRNGQWVKK
jgi:hypothetical protein